MRSSSLGQVVSKSIGRGKDSTFVFKMLSNIALGRGDTERTIRRFRVDAGSLHEGSLAEYAHL
ncbi:hypothetical protein TRAPUB_1553 [Trametes pubescens]|uniref:Uncharacterized protein n=1 Tax=Trametes pubescens TaxID=154538 RepID=A0A1M2VJ74_TRAPU|nr:hypothetical protein TRAPUB_1553 [Trametes pubescens]